MFSKKENIDSSMINLIYEKIERLIDIPKELDFIFNFKLENEKCSLILKEPSSQIIFKKLLHCMKINNVWNAKEFKNIILNIQDQTGVKGKNLWMPIRIVLTGNYHGPDIGSIVEILGKEKCKKRIQAQINE